MLRLTENPTRHLSRAGGDLDAALETKPEARRHRRETSGRQGGPAVSTHAHSGGTLVLPIEPRRSPWHRERLCLVIRWARAPNPIPRTEARRLPRVEGGKGRSPSPPGLEVDQVVLITCLYVFSHAQSIIRWFVQDECVILFTLPQYPPIWSNLFCIVPILWRIPEWTPALVPSRGTDCRIMA